MLSEALDDRTAGLLAPKSRRGVAIVKDPKDGSHPGMPVGAIQNVPVDRILPADGIGPVIRRFQSVPPPAVITPVDDPNDYESRVAGGETGDVVTGMGELWRR